MRDFKIIQIIGWIKPPEDKLIVWTGTKIALIEESELRRYRFTYQKIGRQLEKAWDFIKNANEPLNTVLPIVTNYNFRDKIFYKL